MIPFRCGVLVAMLLVSPAAAAAADPVLHAYPIHFDGPMVRHAQQNVGDVTGNTPKFDVTYHGGPIQPATTSYTIFWQPKGTIIDPGVPPLIDRFFADVGGSSIYGMATTYFGSNGYVKNRSKFGGTYLDTTPYPAKGISDRDLQMAVLRAAGAGHWKPGIGTQFFVFTAKNAIPANGFCAYHSAFDYGLPAAHYIYAFIPYLGTVNGCNEPFGITPNSNPEADGLILNMSHEQMEMVTDPLLNAWYDPRNGEVGDICIYAFGVPIANSGANIVIGKDGYFLQEDYSQAKGSCQPNL